MYILTARVPLSTGDAVLTNLEIKENALVSGEYMRNYTKVVSQCIRAVMMDLWHNDFLFFCRRVNWTFLLK